MLNEDQRYERLFTVAGPALISSFSEPDLAAGPRLAELNALHAGRNGFYAFESALHVFPSGEPGDPITIEYWNTPERWKADYDGLADDLWCFAEDIFGVQFAIQDDIVVQFEPETGERQFLAATLPEWSDRVLGDYERLTGHPFARAWQLRNGPLMPGQRLLPVTPFVLGGPYDVANWYAGGAVEGMRARGNLAVQIRDKPDGTSIEYVVRP